MAPTNRPLTMETVMSEAEVRGGRTIWLPVIAGAAACHWPQLGGADDSPVPVNRAEHAGGVVVHLLECREQALPRRVRAGLSQHFRDNLRESIGQHAV